MYLQLMGQKILFLHNNFTLATGISFCNSCTDPIADIFNLNDCVTDFVEIEVEHKQKVNINKSLNPDSVNVYIQCTSLNCCYFFVHQ